MAKASQPQKHQGWRANSRWILIPSLILFVLNAAIWSLIHIAPHFEDYFYQHFGIDPITFIDQDVNTLLLISFLLLALVYFVVGVLRGLVTGKASSAILLSFSACLFSGIPAYILLPLAYGLITNDMTDSGRLLLFFLLNVLWIEWQMLLGGLIAAGGGLIGSRLHQRARPEEAGEGSA
jgi:hypothetical protein